jgi:hypothetical protein
MTSGDSSTAGYTGWDTALRLNNLMTRSCTAPAAAGCHLHFTRRSLKVRQGWVDRVAAEQDKAAPMDGWLQTCTGRTALQARVARSRLTSGAHAPRLLPSCCLPT